MTNYLQMTKQELHINTVMDRLIKKELTIPEASKLISKCERQTKRIKKKYRENWSEWIIHKSRWSPSNNKIDESKYTEAIQIIKDKYSDYWPTLCSERLAQKHNITVPVSTLRLQMMSAQIWKNKANKKKIKQFTARPRKESYWEMIQYDWSYHLWFEGRNGTEYQCLLVAVDDANWEVTAKFAKNEWLIETFRFWKEYILKNWKPKSIYLDKFSTYKINYPNATDDKQLPTQFWRACNSLNIDVIFANTPQAKWRVERMNGTLQDRLVKALREENISDIETANKYLNDIFLPDFNKHFMVEPKAHSNLHLKLRDDEIENLDQIFAEHKQRKIANDFTIKFNNEYYQLFRFDGCGYTIKPWAHIDVEIHLDGSIKIARFGKYLTFVKSFERPQRIHKLITAPVYNIHKDDTNKLKINKRGDISTLTQGVTF
jgi:hypothetical protein